jgi:hypothetical protein
MFTKTVSSSLDAIANAQSKMQEKRICEIADFAAEALDLMDGLDLDVVSLISLVQQESIFITAAPHKEAIKENLNRLFAHLDALNESDKVNFISLLFELAGERNKSFFEADFLSTEKPIDESFTYVKNQYSDEAYDVFSADFARPRVSYSDTLRNAALAVANGRCSYCLLPFEENGGARLPTVESLINQYDLKIVAVTPVFGPVGTLDLKYALVSKSFIPNRVKKDDDRYLEIRLPICTSLAPLILASDQLGFKLFRVNTLTLTEESSPYYTAVFKSEGKSFATLFAYLTLFQPEYIQVGIYTNIE